MTTRTPRHHAMVDFPQHQESERASCSRCGYEWQRGQDGTHSCANVLRQRLDEVTAQRDAILQQARAWACEAKTQRGTVLEVGAILGGIPDWGPIAAGVEALRRDAVRLDFMLVEHRKVVAERLPGGQLVIYVTEGFMDDHWYPAVPFKGKWSAGSPEALEAQRAAIDAAIHAQESQEVGDGV